MIPSTIQHKVDQISRFHIRVLDPILRFWNRNIDFLKFAIAGELILTTACNRYQMILDLNLASGFWNRNIDFLKFAIVGDLLVVSTCNQYQMILRQVDLYKRSMF